MCPRERGRAVRAGHHGDDKRVVAVEDPDLRAVRVEQLAADRVHVGCRRVAVLLDVRSKPGGGVYPGVPGDAERRALPAEPLPLRGIDVAEKVFDVPDLRVDVAVDHEADDSPPNMSFSTEDWLPWLGDFLKRRGLPGMAVAVARPDGGIEFAAKGWAELRKRPIESETLFELGSIGKTFTAILATELLDLQAPLTAYLPWFEVRSAHDPIRIEHLLTHSAGLIRGADMTADSRFDVWALRDTETGFAPGERFYYSNVRVPHPRLRPRGRHRPTLPRPPDEPHPRAARARAHRAGNHRRDPRADGGGLRPDA